MAEGFLDPTDYRGQPLAVGDHVIYIYEGDGTLSTGTIAYLTDEQMCIASGGWLTIRKARLYRSDGKPTKVRYEAVARTPGEAEARDGRR